MLAAWQSADADISDPCIYLYIVRTSGIQRKDTARKNPATVYLSTPLVGHILKTHDKESPQSLRTFH